MMNMQKMMQKVQDLQKKMGDMQKEMEEIEVVGTAGGGMVSTRATLMGTVRSVSIDDSLLKAEEKEILEDLIVASLNDARVQAEAQKEKEMERIAGDLGIPAGMLNGDMTGGGGFPFS